MFTWKRFILAICTTFLLTLAFIVFILPGVIIDHASSWVSENTGRNLTIEAISINPFSLSIEVRKLQLSDAEQTRPFVSWDVFSTSLSIASLYHRAPIIDELRLENPRIFLQRLAEDLFNFSDLIPQQEDEVSTKKLEEPTRFSINNLSIKGGQIDLVDSSLEEEVHHTIRDLQLVLPSLGNLPYMVENPAQPLFQAVINNSPIHLESNLKLFSNVREMQFNLNLDSIDLPFYLGYIPIKLPVEVRNGKLSLDLDILYRIKAESGGELEIKGRIDLASLDIWDTQQEKLFFMPLLHIEVAASQPLRQEVQLLAVRAYNLEVHLKRDRNGEWNHSRMAATEGTKPSSDEKVEGETSPFKLHVGTIEIHDGVLLFEDLLPTGNFNTVAREINIGVKDFALDPKEGIPFNLSLETERDESLAITGHFMLDPFTLDLQAEVGDIDMAAYEPYYQDVYSVPLGGRLGLQARVEIHPEKSLLISDGMIKWRDAYMAFNEKEGLGVGMVEGINLSFDLDNNRLELDTLRYKDGQANFSRSSEGHWSFLSKNFPILQKLTEAPDQQPASEPEEGVQPFSYRIGELTAENWAFKVNDNVPETPVRLEADSTNLTFNNLAAPERVKSPFTFSTTFQRNGRIQMKGAASLAEQSVSMETLLNKIPLATFAPYIAEQANLVLADGSLNARLQSTVEAGSGPLMVTYGGNIGIDRFHLLDSLHREDLLKWNSLQLAGINGQLEPLGFGIESITLSDYFAKVLIDENSRLNLVEAFHKNDVSDKADQAEETTTVEEKGDKTSESSGEEVTPPSISIGRVSLQGGRVDFTDRSLPRLFHADMRELGGRVQGLSSDPATRAEVDLRGRLRNQSPLVVKGTINPLAEKIYLDIKLNFNDIELSPLSPYSGTYVGYMIEKGKLNLAMEYYLEDEQLKANNKVFLDQFSFGESVESEQATTLPVKLAVALLKDRDGEIHLDIPVSGSLDDPQFSVTGMAWTIIKNLLVKAATSPLALLSTLVGGSDEDFSNVSFEYGSARLDDVEKDKLERMSQALKDRPSLEVEISGFVDPDNDPEGYRKEKLSTTIKRLRYLDLIAEEELPEGTHEDNVVVPAEQYAEYLWQVYRDSDFPKPRSFIGITKKLPVTEMEKLIYTNTPVTEDDMKQLAQARSLAVQKFLVEQGQLTPERVFLIEPDITEKPDQETTLRARVELGATVR